MTEAEARFFQAGRKTGRISFFRSGLCVKCGGEVIKQKLYCSKRCYMETWEAKAVAEKLVGSEVQLETKAGSIRQGRLTGITWHELKVSGHEVKWPKGVILNGDRNDEIDWDQLNWINSDVI